MFNLFRIFLEVRPFFYNYSTHSVLRVIFDNHPNVYLDFDRGVRKLGQVHFFFEKNQSVLATFMELSRKSSATLCM